MVFIKYIASKSKIAKKVTERVRNRERKTETIRKK